MLAASEKSAAGVRAGGGGCAARPAEECARDRGRGQAALNAAIVARRRFRDPRPAEGGLSGFAPVPAATASSAKDRSRADWNRSSGTFSRHRRTMCSVAAPALVADPRQVRRLAPSGSRSPCRPASRGRTPPGRSAPRTKATPSANTSVRGSVTAPANLLGRHVADRPNHRPRRRRRARRQRLGASRSGARGRGHVRAIPKSRTLMRPSFVTKTFSGLRSRWMIPRPCAAAMRVARSRGRSRAPCAAAADLASAAREASSLRGAR